MPPAMIDDCPHLDRPWRVSAHSILYPRLLEEPHPRVGRATHLTKLPLLDIIAWPVGNQTFADRAPASKDCHHHSPSLRLVPKPRSESSRGEHSRADASKVRSQWRSHFVTTCTDPTWVTWPSRAAQPGDAATCRCAARGRRPVSAKVKIILVKVNMILTFAGIIHSRVGSSGPEIVI
jgi:hypothetical protein